MFRIIETKILFTSIAAKTAIDFGAQLKQISCTPAVELLSNGNQAVTTCIVGACCTEVLHHPPFNFAEK